MLNKPARLVSALAILLLGLTSYPIAAQDASSSSAPASSSEAASDLGDPTQSPAIEIAAATMPANVSAGKQVFKTKANCVNCHGWPGDGATGKNPRSPGIAANLRVTQLDHNSLIQIVSCGIPGSAMPYHDGEAYKDNRCYGTTAADYDNTNAPQPGNFLSAQDIINVVAYVEAKIKDRGPITKAECTEFWGANASVCAKFP